MRLEERVLRASRLLVEHVGATTATLTTPCGLNVRITDFETYMAPDPDAACDCNDGRVLH